MEAEDRFVSLPDPTLHVIIHEDRKTLATSRDGASALEDFKNTTDAELDKVKAAAQPLPSLPPRNNRVRFARKLLHLLAATLSTAAKSSGEERTSVLKELFENLSARIESKVIRYFLADGSIRAGQGFGNRHYFELAAEGFGEYQELFVAWDMEGIVSALRSHDVFHSIYVLLFHQWLFLSGEANVKSINLFIAGCEKLFRSDLDSFAFTYRPVYQMLRRIVASKSWWNETIKAMAMDLWALWASYCFYYEKESATVRYNFNHFRLQQLLSKAETSGRVLCLRAEDMTPVQPLSDADVDNTFVKVILKQLLVIKDERVMIRFLNFCGDTFQGLKLSRATSILLQSELYARTKPGSPYYLTDRARVSASSALTRLYPVGNLSRRLVALLFRLLQPYYVLRAFFLYIWAYIFLRESIKK